MASTARPTPLSCLIVFFGFLLLFATAGAGVAAWLAYLRPEKGIEWQPLAWHRVKSGGSFEPFDTDS